LSAVKAPKEIVRALSSTLVFIPILTKDACRMLAAREARIIKKNVSLSWKILSTVVGDLILRGFERAERIDRAVSARTFGDNIEVQVLNVGELDAILLLSTTLILTIYFIF
jgi:energy-coupling factor transporter transmembrane protein EcfT